jgi:predicted metalloprotease with PDZ domain
LGIVVAPGPRAVVIGTAEGSPAEVAGLRPGDEIIMITGTNSGFFGAVQKVRDQAELDGWLATQKSNAKQTLTILRGGNQALNLVMTPAALPAQAAP